MKTDVAVVIVTYNSEKHIANCLRSVFGQRREVRQEVIVLDNQSQDRTAAIVRQDFPEARLTVSERNLGFAAGVNAAARLAQSDFILLLNPDTEILDHAVDAIVAFARAHPKNGLYGGRAFKPDGRLELSSCWGLPDLWSLAMFACGLSTLAKHNRFLDPESLGSWPRDTVREVGLITGCFLLASRSNWEKLRGFDERFFMYGEDADLSQRGRALGMRPLICPEARFVHVVGASSSDISHKVQQVYRAKAAFVRKHWRGARGTAGLALLTLGVGLRALGEVLSAARHKKWLPLWKARRDWLQGYPVERASDPVAPERL